VPDGENPVRAFHEHNLRDLIKIKLPSSFVGISHNSSRL